MYVKINIYSNYTAILEKSKVIVIVSIVDNSYTALCI